MKSIPEHAFSTEVLNTAGKVLVDFYGDHCAPCRAMHSVLEEVAREKADIKFTKVDVAQAPILANQFRVTSLPTFILFENGQPAKQLIGAKTKKQFIQWLES